MIRRNRPWTPEEETRLRALVEEGASAILIAAKVKRTIFAVRARAAVIGVSFRRIKPGQKSKGK